MANNQDLQEDFSQDVKDDQHFNGDDSTGENGNENGTDNGNDNGNDGQNENDQAQQGEAASGRDDDRSCPVSPDRHSGATCQSPNGSMADECSQKTDILLEIDQIREDQDKFILEILDRHNKTNKKILEIYKEVLHMKNDQKRYKKKETLLKQILNKRHAQYITANARVN